MKEGLGLKVVPHRVQFLYATRQKTCAGFITFTGRGPSQLALRCARAVSATAHRFWKIRIFQFFNLCLVFRVNFIFCGMIDTTLTPAPPGHTAEHKWGGAGDLFSG